MKMKWDDWSFSPSGFLGSASLHLSAISTILLQNLPNILLPRESVYQKYELPTGVVIAPRRDWNEIPTVSKTNTCPLQVWL